MANIVQPADGNAEGVFNAIKQALSDFGIDFDDLVHNKDGPALVCCNFDGASVMMGNKGGVKALILKVIPAVIPMHCIAHKLELAVLDSVKHIAFLKKYEATLKGLFTMYRALPKRMRGLKAVSEALDEDLSTLSDIAKV